jgi:hypothetical protein
MLYGAELVYSEINTEHINTVWAERAILSVKTVVPRNQ